MRKQGSDLYPAIWDVVRRIPRGKIATYGQVARVAGFPAHARVVGYALHSLPPGLPIPWQRVINAQGKISFPVGSSSHKEQRRLLEAEGVVFVKGRVDLKIFGWRPLRR